MWLFVPKIVDLYLSGSCACHYHSGVYFSRVSHASIRVYAEKTYYMLQKFNLVLIVQRTFTKVQK